MAAETLSPPQLEAQLAAERKRRVELEGALTIAARELTAARQKKADDAAAASAVPAVSAASEGMAQMAKRVAQEAAVAKAAAVSERSRRKQVEDALKAARAALEAEKQHTADTLAQAEEDRKKSQDLSAALQLAATELHKARTQLPKNLN